jgi:DNA-binding beta-propeller fold protein YncE
MFSDQRVSMAQINLAAKTFLLSLTLLALFAQGLPAFATKLSPAITRELKLLFGDTVKIRLDGSVETKSGDLYLPVFPGGFNTKTAALKLLQIAPSKAQPEAIVFEGGLCFIKVVRKAGHGGLAPLSSFDEKLKKLILTLKFAPDLIVPENFSLASQYKPLVTDQAITIEAEKAHGDQNSAARVHHKSAGGVYITSSASGSIILVDNKSLKKAIEFPTEGTPLGMTLVGEKLYIADQSKSRLLIIDTAAREFMSHQIDLGPGSAPKAVAALPNGHLLYVSESGQGLIDCIETETGKVLVRTKVPPGPSRLAMTPNGNHLLVLNAPTGQVSFISTMNQRLLGSLNVGTAPQFVVISPDSRLAYISCKSSNHVTIVDVVKRLPVGQIKCGNGPTGLAVNHDGSRLFVACAKDNTIEEFDTTSRNKVKDFKLPLDVDFPGGIALEPSGKRLIITSAATDTIGVLEFESEKVNLVSIGRKSNDIIYVSAH